jgi:hypothetical protein
VTASWTFRGERRLITHRCQPSWSVSSSKHEAPPAAAAFRERFDHRAIGDPYALACGSVVALAGGRPWAQSAQL